jgi:tetraprenyl-beta-curcumene synthase
MLKYKTNLLVKFVKNEFPIVDSELKKWKDYSYEFSEEVLAYQAYSSIKHKKFHAQGGSVYALYPEVKIDITAFIVAYQTICDYLDNLCDRCSTHDGAAFRQLHLSLIDALSLEDDYKDYYKFYNYNSDGGYLKRLVLECKKTIRNLPSYHIIKDEVLYLADLYSSLQVYKHLDNDIRVSKLNNWSDKYLARYPEILPCEFWAASGSTLAIFILIGMATQENLKKETVTNIMEVYFPWITGLHILLDYFIDKEEDEIHDDLNFTSFYSSDYECTKRIILFIKNSLINIQKLEHPEFHKTVIEGMLAMYLSDKKVHKREDIKSSKQMFKVGGGNAKIMWRICKILRSVGYI